MRAFRSRALQWGLAAIIMLLPSAARAEGLDSGDTAWILTSTALVLFMTLPGLALFYGGLVQPKNVLSVLMQCFAVACMASILWFLVGYSLAFSDGGALNGLVGGLDRLFLAGLELDSLSGSIPESLFMMFQMTFAIITPALIIGAYPERVRFGAVMLFSLLWLLLVYAPVTHWIWGGGWLTERGIMDFAGGLVVHATAGTAAVVFALHLGPRAGFPEHILPPHRPGMVMMGASMLWVGWFGFNAGSALAAGTGAGMAMTATHISAATASLVWLAIEWLKFGKPSVVGIATGMVAGLATVTPASGYIGPLGGLILGLLGGLCCYGAVLLVRMRMKIDDSLDVFAVHGVGGLLGTLLAPVLATASFGGLGLAEGVGLGEQIGVQALGAVAVVAWTAIASIVILRICRVVTGLRVDERDEVEGLDITSHGERGYHFS